MPSIPAPSSASDASFTWTSREPVCERTLEAAEIAALDELAGQPLARTHDAAEPGETPPLPPACRDISAWISHQLYVGPGYALLRGLPFERWGVDASRWVCWSIACALGVPVSQTAQGARVVDVRDTSREEATPRQFRTSQELRLHTDPASDLMGLACLRPAASGGESVLASAVSVHDAMQRERPDLLQELYRGFRWHRFGEGRREDAPVSEAVVPVFCAGESGVACRYVRSPIVAAHKDAGEPLCAAQIEALNLLDRHASSTDLRHSFRMRTGDLLWVNNIKVLHARTEFTDHALPLPPRHLFRLWLAAPAGVPGAPPEMNFFNAGRCGIPVTGAKAQYDMNSLWQDPASGGVARLGVKGDA